MTIDLIQNKARPAQILLVEDNPGDVILTQRALRDSKISNNITVAKTGEIALEMLRKQGEYADTPKPDLIWLDLNLPQMSGQDVLKIIKDDPLLKHIPVVILSSSQATQDVVKSYSLHANGYVVKPANLESLGDVIRKLESFWFTLVVLPDASDVAQAG